MSIKVKNITYKYDNDEINKENLGIFDISFDAKKGETIGIIGQTGSGKSTLLQHLNGLYLPQKGTIFIEKMKIDKNSKNLIKIRKKVGLVFQYPEDQLFEETVFEDIAFGPKNMSFKKEKIDKNVFNAMNDVGLNFDEYKNRNSYDLSGGEKRKVAIASVLAMGPNILILDEPMAGLDPKSKEEMLCFLKNLRNNKNIIILIVSHDMNDIFLLSDKIIVMKNGKIVLMGESKEVFSKKEFLISLGLAVPYSIEILFLLKKNGIPVDCYPRKKEELINLFLKLFKKK